MDYARARNLLDENFPVAEEAFTNHLVPDLPEEVRSYCNVLFSSETQAYREVLLGCVLARVIDKTVNVRQPYLKQGEQAFSGRSLDERVVNPFLQERRVPCSRGPYLSVFRRSVQFDANTREGLRDKTGYDALLHALEYIESLSEDADLLSFLRYLLYKCVELREGSNIALSRLQRISLPQYRTLIEGLLATASGGRFPVILVVAMFGTLKAVFDLGWEIESQGINVADAASNVSGDITISQDGKVILAVEVTERSVDRPRVIATFNNKIAPAALEDYLFLGSASILPDAEAQAHHYFAQGHEVNLVDVREWMFMCLATVGKSGRAIFNRTLMSLLDGQDVPQTMRVSWNARVSALLNG